VLLKREKCVYVVVRVCLYLCVRVCVCVCVCVYGLVIDSLLLKREEACVVCM